MNRRIAVILALSLAIIGGVVLTQPASAGETCPHTDGWTKVDSGDFSPVAEATEYCFKAGNWPTVSSIPDGGFGQQGEGQDANCNTDIKYCELSHWSYFVPPPPNTPTNTPEPTNTPTPEPSETPTEDTPTPTPTDTDDPGPTPTPIDVVYDPTPSPTEFPRTGDGLSTEPWLCWGSNGYCAHNGVDGSPAAEWISYWPGTVFEFQGVVYTAVRWERIPASQVSILDGAEQYDLILITCSTYVNGVWLDRIIIFANGGV